MADIARVLGVTKQAVHYWETYQSIPTVEHALAYGRVLAALAKRAALGRRPPSAITASRRYRGRPADVRCCRGRRCA